MENFIKNLINKIYKVNDVQQGYFYWYSQLLDMSLDIFEYDGLPKSLPAEEIEKRLLTTGHAIIIQHPTFGLITCDSTLFNFDVYGNFRQANLFNPYRGFFTSGFRGQNLELGKDCICIYNNSIEKFLNYPLQGKDAFFQCLCRYARLLADIESTINIEIVNGRQNYLMIAGDERTKQGIQEIFRNLKRGNLFSTVDKNLYKDSTTLKNHDTVAGYLTELLDTRNKIIKQFFEELGIFSIDDKEERILNAELDNENRNVKLFVYSMLKARKIGIEEVNNLYGTNIEVALRTALYDDSKLYEEEEPETENKEEVEIKEDVENED